MENTEVGWADYHMQLTEPRESKDRGYKLQEFLEFLAECYIMMLYIREFLSYVLH